MDAGRLTAELKHRARREGFDSVGVAAAGRLERDGDALTRWLAAGHEAGMAYMARHTDRRRDPRELLPGCVSVVALAMSYWPGAEMARTPASRARVALYARGRDYHKIMGPKLKALAAWLEEASARPARAFVDTGPVLERAWAERAGIGWIGKNANLLTRDMGSWLLLGEILSAAELEPDRGPHAEFCGTCTACLDACPTDAIIGDGVVDSSRCISYWTIEHRGGIPDTFRSEIGDWIFGCDVCQDVCPWNESFARPVARDRFGVRDDLAGLDPAEILAMDEATFRARYSGTSLMRAKWEGMRRNACVVLGNRGSPSALPVLARTLEDVDPVLREHAVWSIGVIGGADALQLLLEAAERESSGDVRRAMRNTIVRLEKNRASTD